MFQVIVKRSGYTTGQKKSREARYCVTISRSGLLTGTSKGQLDGRLGDGAMFKMWKHGLF